MRHSVHKSATLVAQAAVSGVVARKEHLLFVAVGEMAGIISTLSHIACSVLTGLTNRAACDAI